VSAVGFLFCGVALLLSVPTMVFGAVAAIENWLHPRRCSQAYRMGRLAYPMALIGLVGMVFFSGAIGTGKWLWML